jgi:hypothetical protein
MHALKIGFLCKSVFALFISLWCRLGFAAAFPDTLLVSGTFVSGANLVMNGSSQMPEYAHGYMMGGGAGFGLKLNRLYVAGIALEYAAAMNRISLLPFEGTEKVKATQTLHFIEPQLWVERKLHATSPWVLGLRFSLPILASGSVTYKNLPETNKRKSTQLNLSPYRSVNPVFTLRGGYQWMRGNKENYVYVFGSWFTGKTYRHNHPMRWAFIGAGYRFSVLLN